ncbi:precorrin-6A/cobalt-precorrin-6A reductase, partial [Mycobacterium paraintracellulare]|uniref:precorrin-6A/cobalt-precorrin-6A reductase n=1 Tax=Mycobacterium paraintracellulare TaxID=1138383 RepID=UPI001914E1CB
GSEALSGSVTARIKNHASLPRHHRLVLSRGPYRYDEEVALLREHRIDALVTKNSGGQMTRAKLDAAAS